MSKLLRTVTVCGVEPLAAGICIYVAWLITRADILMFIGMLNIGLGVVAFFIGLVCLAFHHFGGSREGAGRPCRSWPTLLLLLLNFPVAAFCVLSASYLHSRYTLSFRNESPVAIESLVITGPGISSEIGPVAPGESKCVHFHFEGEGSVTFDARQGADRFSGCIDGYINNGVGEDREAVVRSPGKWEMSSETQTQR